MEYPSTTQALFALIVMIIVLAFILVYCCWGTFSCPQPHDGTGAGANGSDGLLSGRDSPNPPALVILPYHSMIYIGDRRTQQVYQIPIREDKPPSYRDIFNSLPPPPSYNSCTMLAGSEQPPTYDECVQNGEIRTGNSQRCLSLNETESLSSSSSHPLPSTIPRAQLILSPAGLHKDSYSSVFRARSLLTVITSSSSSIPHTSQVEAQRYVPTISVLSSNPPVLHSNTVSRSLAPTTFSSFTTSSSPCLPSTFDSSSNSLK